MSRKNCNRSSFPSTLWQTSLIESAVRLKIRRNFPSTFGRPAPICLQYGRVLTEPQKSRETFGGTRNDEAETSHFHARPYGSFLCRSGIRPDRSRSARWGGR